MVDILDPEMNLAEEGVEEEEEEAPASESSASMSNKFKTQTSEKAEETRLVSFPMPNMVLDCQS